MPRHRRGMPFLRDRAASFRHAFRGIAFVLRTQRNAGIHLTATVAVIVAGGLLRISRGEWFASSLPSA